MTITEKVKHRLNLAIQQAEERLRTLKEAEEILDINPNAERLVTSVLCGMEESFRVL